MKKRGENSNSLSFPLKDKYLAMLAPSFVVDFYYPEIVCQLKLLGFDKIVELTFGAKMVNREYHKELGKKENKFLISSVCPGIVFTLSGKTSKYKKNLAKIDSPMIAMAKICRKNFPKHKIVFISPCNFKKIEAKNSGLIDYCIDYTELRNIIREKKIVCNKKHKNKFWRFDSFYNEYTKIYPLAGGLSKTAHLKGIIKKEEVRVIDGINNVLKYLKKPNKKIKFLDANFCVGGCIGGPCVASKLPTEKRKQKVISYLNSSKKLEIPVCERGKIENAKGISFRK